MIERKILMIGRHGKAPQKPEGGSYDSLVPGAVGEVYANVGLPLNKKVKELHYLPQRTFLTHTDAVRTKYTGQAVLIGAFNMQPEIEEIHPPQNLEHLDNYFELREIVANEDSDFNIRRPHCSLKVYKRDGDAAIIDYWLDNQKAVEHEGDPIIPYAVLSRETRRGIKANLERLDEDGYDLGVLVTHGSVIEPTLINLINTGRTTPVRRVEEIGGPFHMAEFAELTIDQNKSGLYAATLKVKNKDYKVDLSKL